jgi:hypothetical protein
MNPAGEPPVPLESHGGVKKHSSSYDQLKCYHCGSVLSRPYLWKSGGRANRNEFNQTIPIVLVTRCCGATAHTEPVAFALDYLHDGRANADRICEAMNATIERAVGRSSLRPALIANSTPQSALAEIEAVRHQRGHTEQSVGYASVSGVERPDDPQDSKASSSSSDAVDESR